MDPKGSLGTPTGVAAPLRSRSAAPPPSIAPLVFPLPTSLCLSPSSVPTILHSKSRFLLLPLIPQSAVTYSIATYPSMPHLLRLHATLAPPPSGMSSVGLFPAPFRPPKIPSSAIFGGPPPLLSEARGLPRLLLWRVRPRHLQPDAAPRPRPTSTLMPPRSAMTTRPYMSTINQAATTTMSLSAAVGGGGCPSLRHRESLEHSHDSRPSV